MNRSQQVKKIIGSAIEEYGFEYKGYDRDEYVSFYSFEKKDGDLEQYITIVVSGGKLQLELGTNAYGQKDARASALIDSKFKGGNDFQRSGRIADRSGGGVRLSDGQKVRRSLGIRRRIRFMYDRGKVRV